MKIFRKILVSFMMICAMLSTSLAAENTLLHINIMPRQAGSVRIDFDFAHPLKQLPPSFLLKKPRYLIIDFKQVDSALEKKWKLQTVNTLPLNTIAVVVAPTKTRVIVQLASDCTQVAHIRGNRLTLTLSNKLKSQEERISLNFQSIPLRAILQQLAKIKGINMVIADTVTGNITLNLKNISWEEAMEIILETHGLVKKQAGSVIFIDTKESLRFKKQKTLKSVMRINKLEPLESVLLPLHYAKAADIANLLKDKNNLMLSRRGAVTVDLRTNTLWIQDTSVKIAHIRELVLNLDIPVEQVLIEARIVAVNKDFAEDLGVRLGLAQSSPVKFNANASLADKLHVDLAAMPLTTPPATIGFVLTKLGAGVLLDLELSALETEGHGEIIASPRLITTNQQTALIQSGQDIPYQESTSSGATSVSFKKAVLSLKVTPQITAMQKIMLALEINQDTTSGQTYNGVPAINTRQIQTNVLVNNGETVVLGGVYKREKNVVVKRVPFLSKLPAVGYLFRNSVVKIKNEELLIFITPRIIANTMVVKNARRSETKIYQHLKSRV